MIFTIRRPADRALLHERLAPLLLGIARSMNSGQEATEDLPDAEDGELDTGPLQDSQDAIDKGREAAREALKDTLPDTDDQTGGPPEQETENPESES